MAGSICNPLKNVAIGAFLSASIAAAAWAADWPGYRGPTHDGTTTETVAPWLAGGPKELWRVPVGRGLGSFAVAGKGAYLFVADEGTRQEACVRLDADTGKPLWTMRVGPTSTDGESMGAPIPRSTPAIDGERVYVYGSLLKLSCLNAADGKILWQHDLLREFAGRNIKWDNATSPIIDGDRVVVAGGGPGQSLIAFNKETGSVVWKTGDEKLTHASPTVATILGVRQVIFFLQSGLVAIDSARGKELWRYKFPFNVSTASTPIVGADRDGALVYCSAGYGSGTGVVRVRQLGSKQFNVEEAWFHPDKDKRGAGVNHWTTPVYKDRYLYGIYGFKQFGTGPLKCIELATGKEMWSRDGFGSGGGTVLAGDTLVVQSDTGRVALVEATPKAYHELAAAQPLHPQPPYDTSVRERCWTMAVVANGRIYARSSTEAVCLKD
jgi:outer membrane protein assembly factor BamB